MITEISPVATESSPAWIELLNPLESTLDVSGLVLGFSDGVEVRLDVEIDPLPPGGYLEIVADRKIEGVNIESLPTAEGHESGQRVVAHIPQHLPQVWNPSRGQLALYRRVEELHREEALIDFVAWGGPPSPGWTRAHLGGVWPARGFVQLEESSGLYDPHTELRVGHSIGLVPGGKPGHPTGWRVYGRDEVTRGAPNGLPRPRFFTPPYGAAVDARSFSIAWNRLAPRETYEIQFSSTPGFPGAIEPISLERPYFKPHPQMEPGHYYYRVRRLDVDRMLVSEWSYPVSVQLAQTTCGEEAEPAAVTKFLHTEHRYQRKDTHLLCLSDCDATRMGNPHTASPLSGPELDASAAHVDLENCGSDSENVDEKYPAHGSRNCVRASISMIVSHYDEKCLSQDRIAFFTDGEETDGPEGDLAHCEPMTYSPSACPACDLPVGGEITRAFQWALGIEALWFLDPFQVLFVNVMPALLDNEIAFAHGYPIRFEHLKDWIDDGRPVMTRNKAYDEPTTAIAEDGEASVSARHQAAHARVITGYCIEAFSGNEWLYIRDPKILPHWQTYDSWAPHAQGTWIAPVVAPLARQDEDSVWADSDNDGVRDFDELYRFSTDPEEPDTDGDGIDDLAEAIN